MTPEQWGAAITATVRTLVEDYTQDELARLTGIPRVTLQRRLSGVRMWTIIDLACVCEVIGLTLTDIAERARGYVPIPDREQRARACRTAIRAAGLRNWQIADALGVTEATVSRKLNGRSPIRPAELDKIAQLTGQALVQEAEAIAAQDAGVPTR